MVQHAEISLLKYLLFNIYRKYFTQKTNEVV